MQNFSILTLNLAVEYPWDSKKDILIATIKRLNPDFLCFQEIFGLEKVSQAHGLENSLGYSHTQSLTMPYSTDNLSGYFGSATFFRSAYEPKEAHKVLLSKTIDGLPEDKLQRSFIATKHLIEDKDFWLINIHFSTDFEYRKYNWKELEDWLNKHVSEGNALLMCGDFNTYGKNNDGIGDIQEEILRSGFKDAWSLVNDEKCITYKSSDWWLENYPSSREAIKLLEKNRSYTAKALDYFFVNAFVKVKRVETIDSENKVSDHLGLFMTFGL